MSSSFKPSGMGFPEEGDFPYRKKGEGMLGRQNQWRPTNTDGGTNTTETRRVPSAERFSGVGNRRGEGAGEDCSGESSFSQRKFRIVHDEVQNFPEEKILGNCQMAKIHIQLSFLLHMHFDLLNANFYPVSPQTWRSQSSRLD